MFKSIIAAAAAFFSKVSDDVVAVFKQAETAAVNELDLLLAKYTPVAVEQVTAAAKDATLTSDSEKRSAAFTKLSEQLQADGHDAMSEGFTAFVNLLIETGVNLVKLAEGTFLKAVAPAAMQEQTAQE